MFVTVFQLGELIFFTLYFFISCWSQENCKRWEEKWDYLTVTYIIKQENLKAVLRAGQILMMLGFSFWFIFKLICYLEA